MHRRFLTGFVFAGVLAFSALVPAGCSQHRGPTVGADFVIRVAPPRRVNERRDRAPGRDYVWVSGYHRWQGQSYAWVAGRWERRPHPRARWEGPRYVRRQGGYIFVEGRWR
jgi:hypothetical protein